MSDKILGAHGANEEVLDQVQAAIAGEPLPHASLLPYEAPDAYEPQDCEACNGHGMVGGLRSDGYDGEICPACGGTCEQPDTVAVPRELLGEAESIIDSYAEALRASHAPGGDWDGEEAAHDEYELEAGVASKLRALLAGGAE